MLYDGSTLATLSEELRQLRSQLIAESNNLQGAAGRLQTAWEDNDGLAEFKRVKNNWDLEFGTEGSGAAEVDTTIGKLDALAQAVDSAMAAARGADGKVAQSFGG